MVSEREWLLLRGRLRAVAPFAALPVLAFARACADDDDAISSAEHRSIATKAYARAEDE
jgi:hypothetical protein